MSSWRSGWPDFISTNGSHKSSETGERAAVRCTVTIARGWPSRGETTTARHMVRSEMIPSALLDRVTRGEAVVYPTSTQPALGCAPEGGALDRLFELKQRRSDARVSLAVADLDQAEELVHVPEGVTALLASFPAGSLTLVLPAHHTLDVRLGGDSVAVRVVAHPVAHALLSETGPLTATSANISGTPPHADCGDAAASLGLPPEAALVGHCPGSTPSTFIRLDDSAPLTHAEQLEVLREGVIPTAEVMSWSTSRT